MDQKWKEFFLQAAIKSNNMGPYYAIGVVQGICENAEISASEKIEHIRYFLDQLMAEPEKEV